MSAVLGRSVEPLTIPLPLHPKTSELTGLCYSKIAQRFEQILRAAPATSDVLALNDKLALLWSDDRKVVEGTPEDLYVELDCTELERSDESPAIPEIPEAKAFLVESEDFQWLLDRIRTASQTMSTGRSDADVREALISIVGTSRECIFELDWVPVQFANEQYGQADGCELSSVICICGSGINVQAITCEDYMNTMWPRLGQALVSQITTAMHIGLGAYKGTYAHHWTPVRPLTPIQRKSQTTSRLTSISNLIVTLSWLQGAQAP